MNATQLNKQLEIKASKKAKQTFAKDVNEFKVERIENLSELFSTEDYED